MNISSRFKAPAMRGSGKQERKKQLLTKAVGVMQELALYES
jgi:hypothetical protein